MLSILLPVLNEEQNIQRVKKELIPVLTKLNEKYEIIFVDDGSTDKTVAEILKLKKLYKNINLINHNTNKGLGCTIRTGIDNCKGDLLVVLDADFTFHPNQIPSLLNCYKKTEADCIIGSHLKKRGSSTADVIFYRLLLSRIVNYFYRILLGKKIFSISSIFRLYKVKSLKKLNLTSTGFNINAEILFKLLQQKCNIVEIPAVLTTRIYGKSKINTIKEIKNHLILLSKIVYWKISSSS